MPVAPPRPRDLPLGPLRAFEAAARLGGFKAAAEELGVTPGAVTAQIKALEAAVGVRLFDRTARGVRLTAEGARAAPGLTAAFDRLRAAMQDLRGAGGQGVVHVAALPSLAQLWLSPRLPALHRALGVTVSITAVEAPPNLKRQPYDLCLFYGPEPQGRLADDVIFPVCAPGLAARLSAPEDLAGVPCLSDSTWTGDWDAWAALAMPGRAFTPRGPVFSLYALAVEAAVNGGGVLMGHAALVEPLLAKGALVEPFALRVTLPRGLRLWASRPGPTARRVMRWLAQEAPRGIGF